MGGPMERENPSLGSFFIILRIWRRMASRAPVQSEKWMVSQVFSLYAFLGGHTGLRTFLDNWWPASFQMYTPVGFACRFSLAVGIHLVCTKGRSKMPELISPCFSSPLAALHNDWIELADKYPSFLVPWQGKLWCMFPPISWSSLASLSSILPQW